jgi:beta-lactamase regulating signal transducer with metallopeptidase domain/biopolymer transport protein ExbD
MIELLNSWGSSWVAYFGPAVLQNTVFLGLIILALHFLRNARAGLCYALCLIGLAKLLLPPFLPTGLVLTPETVTPAASAVNLSSSAAAGTSAAAGHGAGTGLGFVGFAFAFWVTMMVSYLAYSALSALRLRHKLRHAVPVGELESGRRHCRQVKILKTDAVPVPLTFGLLRPMIYVPEAWENWSHRCRSMVLSHELAHIRRWDMLGQALQAVLKALYFFHPLVWLLDRRTNEYREMACDDAATAGSAGDALDYSRHLIEIAEGAVLGRLPLRSVSAILKHRKGLLPRISYQLEVKRMKTTPARTRVLVLAGLLLFILPLSWYCGRAETEQGGPTSGSAAAKTPTSMQDVTVVLGPGEEVSVDGKAGTLRELPKMLQELFPSGMDNVLVRMRCEDGVGMDRVSETHEILVGLDLTKVIYEGAPEEGLPLILPSAEHREKLAQLAGEHVAVLKINVPGRILLDGEPIKLTQVKQAITERLADDPHLVVSLVWAPTARYDDFLMVLALVKAAGAKRIAVPVGS